MRIRPAQPADYVAIVAIWYGSARSMDGGVPDLEPQSRLMERLIGNLAGGWVLEVAESGGLLAGFVALFPDESRLDQLFVAPDMQNQGVGAALLDRAKRKMPGGFSLRTSLKNLAGHRFYERHGLRFLRDAPHPVTGTLVRYFAWSGAHGRRISPRRWWDR